MRFNNESSSEHDGYLLELLFPIQIPVQCHCDEYEITDPVSIDGKPYKQLALRSSETVFWDQTVQILDQRRRPLSYHMNDDLYYAAGRGHWEFRWNFYAGNLPAVKEGRPWDEMHEF